MNPGLTSIQLFPSLLAPLVSTLLQSPCVHFIHIFSVAQVSQKFEECQTPSSQVHPTSVRRSGLKLVAEHLEEATLSGRLCDRKKTTGRRGVGIYGCRGVV